MGFGWRTFAPPEVGFPLAIATVIGLLAWASLFLTGQAVFEPLLFSLLGGMLFGNWLGERYSLRGGVELARKVLIPLGLIFYAGAHLDVARVADIPPRVSFVLLLTVTTGFLATLWLGRRFGQHRQISCLVAVGTAICGASAIAMTAPLVDGEPDDVSLSLLAVTVAALAGLFIILPFCGALLNLGAYDFGLLSGAVLQFTGFVRAATAHIIYLPANADLVGAARFAMLVKTVRFLGLLVAIPVVATIIRRRLHLPFSLWLFVGAGMAGSWLRWQFPEVLTGAVQTMLEQAYLVLWAVAMAAIGLCADVRQLLSDRGYLAMGMAAGGFGAALLGFFVFRSLLLPGGGGP